MINETEEIPSQDFLFRRIHKSDVKDGEIVPGTFREIGEGDLKGMSTDWDKYSTAEESLGRCKNPLVNGILKGNVGQVLEIKLLVKHKPEVDNRAHANVNGIEGVNKAKIRLQLLEIFNWEILIQDSQDLSSSK